MAQVVADAPTEVERGPGTFTRKGGSSVSRLGMPGSRPPAAGGPGQPTGNGGSLFSSALASAPDPSHGETHDAAPDLEIGEASRVVKLPMLARHVGQAAHIGAPGLPGMGSASSDALLGRGTGSYDQTASGPLAGLPVVRGGSIEVPRQDLMRPSRRRPGMVMPIAIAAAALVGVVSVLLYAALSEDEDDLLVRRGQVGGKGGLAFQFGERTDKKADDKPADAPRGGTRRASPRRSTRVAGTTTSTATIPVSPDSDEVDLSVGEEPPGELDPDDLVDVYNANKIGVTMCYNSALKRDPLLTVRRADVQISVSPAGSVSNVSIPSLSGTPLGICLEKRIRSWKFPRATRVFTSQFPIIFQT
jgi:hypothetical protein